MKIDKEVLLKARTDKGLSQQEVAEMIGVSQRTYSMYEQGTRNPKHEKIQKLEQVLELSSDAEHYYVLKTGTKSSKTNSSIPYYPEANASAGLNFLSNNDNSYKLPISIPNVDAEAFINVFGDSMYPKYSSGEIIGIKQIDKELVFFGHAYVVQMIDGEAYLKYIKKGRDQHHWFLCSENDSYEPQEFKLSKIEKVFIIKVVISKTTLL